VSLINCEVYIPSDITALTGITQAMVDSAPPVAKVLPELLRFIGNDALAAHNASFDAKFLAAESERLALQAAYSELICSLLLSRRLAPGLGSYSLRGWPPVSASAFPVRPTEPKPMPKSQRRSCCICARNCSAAMAGKSSQQCWPRSTVCRRPRCPAFCNNRRHERQSPGALQQKSAVSLCKFQASMM